MSSFTKVAPHYDDLMNGVPYAMWVSYLKLLWSHIDAKPKKVLEVCCGTGKLCRMLASEGYEMAGVDLSPQMVAEARKNSSDIRFEAQNAAHMELGDIFDAAFSFFDSFNYITDPSDCANAMKRTAAHLKPSGSFAFDLNAEYAFEQNMFDQQSLKPNDKVRYKWKSDYDKESKICTVRMQFWAGDEEFTETHLQRAHSREEIEKWMEEAGFEHVRFYDAYTLDPPRGRSDRIHVIGTTRP